MSIACVVGTDLGSTTTKSIVLDARGEILGRGITNSRSNYDQAAKVARTEELDAAVPRITALKPDVLIVTGDHSTPSKLGSHSWHPVPTLLVADSCRTDACERFGERDCLSGGLGMFPAKHLMLQAMAHAGRFGKFGA